MISGDVLANLDELNARYTNADPFPFVSIENFFEAEAAGRLLQDFPPFGGDGVGSINEFGKHGLKYVHKDMPTISAHYKTFSDFLISLQRLKKSRASTI